MNKRHISEKIFKELRIKRFEAYHFIDLLIDVIVENLKLGNKVMISNFGTFKVVKRQPKKVLNPNNKKPMIIPAGKVVKFFAAKKFKNLINKG